MLLDIFLNCYKIKQVLLLPKEWLLVWTVKVFHQMLSCFRAFHDYLEWEDLYIKYFCCLCKPCHLTNCYDKWTTTNHKCRLHCYTLNAHTHWIHICTMILSIWDSFILLWTPPPLIVLVVSNWNSIIQINIHTYIFTHAYLFARYVLEIVPRAVLLGLGPVVWTT